MANTVIPIAGHELGKILVDALGLQGRGVQRIVIESDVRNVAKVYVCCLFPKEAADKIAAGLAQDVAEIVECESVEVGPNGEIVAKPKAV